MKTPRRIHRASLCAPRSRITSTSLVVMLLAAWPIAAGAQATEAAQSATTPSRVIQLDVRVNGRSVGTWPVLEKNGYLYAPLAGLELWRLRRREEVPIHFERDQRWYPLAAVRGSELRVAFADSRLELQVPESSVLHGGLPPLVADLAVATAPTGVIAPMAVAVTLPAQVSAPKAPTAPMTISPTAKALSAAAPAGTQPPPAASATMPSNGVRYLPMAVSVNGSGAGNWVLIEQRGVIYAPEDAFEEWRVSRSPAAQPIEVRGQRWYALASVPGFESQINFANQSIDLKFSPKAFATTKLVQEVQNRPELTPSIPAAFVNYDLSYTTQANKGLASSHDMGALLELGVSNDMGVLTSSYAGTGLIHSDPSASTNWRRLETTFTRDFPRQNLTARLGDSSTRVGIGGRSTYFGGLQIGRNFGLSPGFISQPIPTLTGTSNSPSTVELYINDALRQTSRVPTGPFAIDNFPLLTGSGEARVVVRDLLGRETVLVQNFFTHSSLLEQGLSDWSYELGAVRKNMGSANADYGQRFTSGLYRYGLNKQASIETRAQIGQETRLLGAALSHVLPWQMLGQFSVSASSDKLAGQGHQVIAGVEHRSLRHGFSYRAESNSSGYRQLGQDATILPTKLQQSASYNYVHPDWGNWGMGFARVDSYTVDPLATYSLNHSRKLGDLGSLALTYTKVNGAGGGTAVGMSLMVPLGKAHISSSSVTHRDGKLDAFTSVTNGLTEETGVGYRAMVGTREGQGYSEAGVYFQGGKGMLTADISASHAQQTLRVGATGGLAAASGKIFASRKIDNSFAIVEVPGYPGVGVGFQGSSLTKTDEDGVAVLPRLLPYQVNSIRLDPRELPINAEIDNIEQMAVPAARSAVKVVFPVRTGRGALLRLVLDDGQPAPAGAEIELVGDKQEFFVARRGEAFVTGLQPSNHIRMKYNDQTCTVKVDLPEGKSDEIARVGPLLCSGVKR